MLFLIVKMMFLSVLAPKKRLKVPVIIKIPFRPYIAYVAAVRFQRRKALAGNVCLHRKHLVRELVHGILTENQRPVTVKVLLEPKIFYSFETLSYG